jgi:hypothetical protein
MLLFDLWGNRHPPSVSRSQAPPKYRTYPGLRPQGMAREIMSRVSKPRRWPNLVR